MLYLKRLKAREIPPLSVFIVSVVYLSKESTYGIFEAEVNRYLV